MWDTCHSGMWVQQVSHRLHYSGVPYGITISQCSVPLLGESNVKSIYYVYPTEGR
jgi:hypothetical protein